MSQTTYQHDTPIGETRLDRNVQGVLGQGLDRHEGPLKVSGTATYAYENHHGSEVAYGYIVTAGIGSAGIVSIDTKAALAAPGVLHVVSGNSVPRSSADPGTAPPMPVAGEVVYYGQPIAMVVAESYEAARDAAKLVAVTYESRPGRYDPKAEKANATKRDKGGVMPADTVRGDFEKAYEEAEIRFDATYTTPSQSHSAMEPHASVAHWQGDELTLHGSYQMIEACKQQLAKAVGISPDKVRVISPYIGGGFGSKIGLGPEAVFAALASKAIDRPVKVALTRPQVMQTTSRRADTIQRVRIGVTKAGRITAIAHDTWTNTTVGGGFFEPAGISTVFLYAGENRQVTHRLADVNIIMASAMRAPGEAVGMLALENAMDELAETLGLDPIEFRRLNEPDSNPQDDTPFSTRKLVECMDLGAEQFGWADRPKTPGSRREGEWLIGIGMAAASRKNLLQTSSAEVRLEADGRATVTTGMTDIGTGTYTILAQIAGEMLGLPMERIEVRLGDTTYPPSAGSGGSWGAASSGSSVYVACQNIVEQLADKLGVSADDLTLKDGSAVAGNRQTAYADILQGEAMVATGTLKPGSTRTDFHQSGYGAHFCEVGVNAVTGETRVRRMLSVFEAGRILNEKTARSQCYGGMIFGIGAALTEDMVVDPRSGLIVNHDLAEYHVPVNADIPQLEVAFVDALDPAANPLSAKGIGELGISGVGAAVTNAIYNACGVRVRDYPMTLDKVLAGMPRERFAEAAE